ncbi:hypothetical protein [Pilibacter termitis]|uniref:hypothetical protein n=1 Tax=Pilibacter termitis TaxID=263852 RepID=UPI00135671F4|nr:hypothetical protein [Pilibacter termitis]
MSRAVHILETKFRAALRTATRLLPLVARQRKARGTDRSKPQHYTIRKRRIS